MISHGLQIFKICRVIKRRKCYQLGWKKLKVWPRFSTTHNLQHSMAKDFGREKVPDRLKMCILWKCTRTFEDSVVWTIYTRFLWVYSIWYYKAIVLIIFHLVFQLRTLVVRITHLYSLLTPSLVPNYYDIWSAWDLSDVNTSTYFWNISWVFSSIIPFPVPSAVLLITGPRDNVNDQNAGFLRSFMRLPSEGSNWSKL